MIKVLCKKTRVSFGIECFTKGKIYKARKHGIWFFITDNHGSEWSITREDVVLGIESPNMIQFEIVLDCGFCETRKCNSCDINKET